MDEKEALYRRIMELDEQFEKNKSRRILLMIAGFAVFFFYLFWQIAGIESIEDLAGGLVVSVVGAGIYVVANLCIFMPVFQKGREENDLLKELQKRYNELNK